MVFTAIEFEIFRYFSWGDPNSKFDAGLDVLDIIELWDTAKLAALR